MRLAPIAVEQNRKNSVTTDELICPCGITFEPPPWFDEDRDEPLCDECAHLRS
jgi:hypothetical protein